METRNDDIHKLRIKLNENNKPYDVKSKQQPDLYLLNKSSHNRNDNNENYMIYNQNLTNINQSKIGHQQQNKQQQLRLDTIENNISNHYTNNNGLNQNNNQRQSNNTNTNQQNNMYPNYSNNELNRKNSLQQQQQPNDYSHLTYNYRPNNNNNIDAKNYQQDFSNQYNPIPITMNNLNSQSNNNYKNSYSNAVNLNNDIMSQLEKSNSILSQKTAFSNNRNSAYKGISPTQSLGGYNNRQMQQSPTKRPPHNLPPLMLDNQNYPPSMSQMSFNPNGYIISNDPFQPPMAYNTNINNNVIPRINSNTHLNNMNGVMRTPINNTNIIPNVNGTYNNNEGISSETFDALESRRRLLNELSSSNLIRTGNITSANNRSALLPNTSFYQISSSTNRNRLSNPVSNIYAGNDTLREDLLEENIVSDDMDELIDVMAKRRLAIKKLENEINRQHSRISTITRPSLRNSQVNLRYTDPTYSTLVSRLPSTQQLQNATINYDPTLSVYQTRSSTLNNSTLRLNDNLTPTANVLSNYDYPSEANREIYSTYLVDSLRPHYSAKKLLSGKMPSNEQSRSALIESPNELDFMNTLDAYDTQLTKPMEHVSSLSVNRNVKSNISVNENALRSESISNREASPAISKPGGIKREPSIQQTPKTSMVIEKLISPSLKASLTNLNDSLDFSESNELKKTDNEIIPSTSRTYMNHLKTKEVDPLDSPKYTPRKSVSEAKTKPVSLLDTPRNDNDLNTTAKTVQESPRKSSTPVNKPRTGIALKYPTLYDARKSFWAAATIVRCIIRLKIKTRNGSIFRTDSASIFRTRLLEIMTALHRVYLEPEGPIYSSLIAFVKNPNDMNVIFNKKSPIFEECINIVCQQIEEITQRITEFMPKEGIIGTTSKSALLSLISEGNKFPDFHFWKTEKERLVFDDNGKIKKINRQRAILLLMSTTISRGLITTLLVKPIKFRFLRGELDQTTKNNLKILATILCYVVRLVNDNSNRKLDFPLEWQDSLFSDLKMNDFYSIPQVDETLTRCKELFINWTSEYIDRLDETAGLKR